MSPEQIKAELDKVSPESDVWALGIIAHRLLVGTEPWSATTITALIAQIAYEPLPVPSQAGSTLGPAFDDWFARCCAREPHDRFPTAGEAVASLARALEVADDPLPSRVSAGVSTKRGARRTDEMASTAFSATTPSPLASEPAPTLVPPRPRSSRVRIALGAAVLLLAGSIGSWAYLHRGPAAAQPTAAVDATSDPAPRTTAAPPPSVEVTVRPSTTVAPSAETMAPAPSAAVNPALAVGAHRPLPHATSMPPTSAPTITAAPTAAPAATPKKPDDPLGSRY
jgi:serine/threonine-protein kinase